MKTSANTIMIGMLFVVAAVFLIAAGVNRDPYAFETSAVAMHDELLNDNQYVEAITVKQWIDKKTAGKVLIDIRNPQWYDKKHIEGAINIPMTAVLEPEYKEIFKSDNEKVLICGNGVKANQVYVLLSQYGYKNLKVLKGGLMYWFDVLNAGNVFDAYPADDEKAFYNFKKVMEEESNGEVQRSEEESDASKLAPPVRRKKKAVQGGCS